jgi:hypothetical protein
VHLSIKFILEQTATVVICYFWVAIVKDNENWLLVFKNNARRGFLAHGSNGKATLARGRKDVEPLCSMM